MLISVLLSLIDKTKTIAIYRGYGLINWKSHIYISIMVFFETSYVCFYFFIFYSNPSLCT